MFCDRHTVHFDRWYKIGLRSLWTSLRSSVWGMESSVLDAHCAPFEDEAGDDGKLLYTFISAADRIRDSRRIFASSSWRTKLFVSSLGATISRSTLILFDGELVVSGVYVCYFTKSTPCSAFSGITLPSAARSRRCPPLLPSAFPLVPFVPWVLHLRGTKGRSILIGFVFYLSFSFVKRLGCDGECNYKEFIAK